MFAIVTLAGQAQSQVPHLLNYQGRVAVGSPPVNFDGTGQFKFALVNTDGSVTYWSNDGTSTAGGEPATAVPLTVTKGLYSVLLGDASLTHMTAIPAGVWSNADVRLRVWFDDGVNGAQLLTPDQRLAPQGYLPDGVVTSEKLAAGAVSGAAIADGAVVSSHIAAGTVLPTQSIAGTSQTAEANTSYLATDESLTRIDLPNSASVGDVVQITGGGAGGWAAHADGPAIWTARESNRQWRSLASSADGSKLVAVASGGQIYTSTDFGVSWTARESNRGWYSVASSADGSKLVAVVQSGQIYTSTDSGVSWTARESNRGWYSVASSADGSKLVAVENGGQIYTSTDSGESWTPRESNRSWASVASSADGSKLVAVDGIGSGSGGRIYTSTDSGESWTARESNRYWQSVASSADGSKLVAVEYPGQIYTSADSGVNWTARESNRDWISVASSADGSKLVAVVQSGQIYTSTDSGVSWTARESNRGWYSVASSADGSKLVAGVQYGQIYTSGGTMASGGPGAVATLQHLGDGQWRALGAANGTVASTQLASDLTLGGTTSGSFNGDLMGNATTATTAGSATNFSGALAGDVTGTQSATVVSSVGGSSAADVHSAELLANAATSANTANALVRRDGSGSFSGDLMGNASTATTAGSAMSFSGSLAGDVTGTQSATSIAAATVTGKALTGFASATGTITAADSLLSGIGKLDGNLARKAPLDSPAFTGTVSLPAGTETEAPLLLQSGTSLTTPEFGALEFDGTNLFLTNDSGSPTRKTLAFTDSIISAGQIDDGTITGAMLANGTVTSSHIAAGTVLPTQSIAGTSQMAEANTSYLATNDSLTSLDLPDSASVGDVVQVTGGGAGGWIANAYQPDIWTARESDRYWTSVASSADGQKLVAVVSAGQIYTSTDSGVSWTARESNRGWYSVASSADGSKLVAVDSYGTGSGGQIYTSTDSGVSWTARESNRTWYSVASSADGSKLVAVEYGGQIYTSTNGGVSWTARESNRSWYSVASSADGSKLVAVAQNGQIYTSADSGVSWTARESDRQWQSVASSADGSKLVAVALESSFGYIYTSTDSGVSWTKHDVLGFWTSVASSADGSKLVAVQGGFSGPIYTSTDSGVSWTEREGNRAWRSVASSADGSKLVAVQNGGQIYTSGSAVASGGPGTVATLQHLGDGQWRALGAADGTVASAQLAPDLTLGGITSGSFNGDLMGNASTATTAGSATDFSGLLAGDVTGTQSATSIAAATVTGKVLTGFASATGTITAADSLLSAIGKLDGNLALKAPLDSPVFSGTVSLPAGTETEAPLLLQSGTSLTTPEFGALEFDGTNLFLTNDSGSPTRKTLAFTDSIISAGQIDDGTITGAMLANGTVTSSHIAAGTVLPTQSIAGTTQEAAANTSYLATDESLTSLGLPDSASVGDVVQITGGGAGGWIANAYQPDIWTARESNRYWQSVASSADGQKLVAVVSAGQIYTSTDFGVSWTARESNRGWYSVASSADGSKLVAVVQSGQIYTSTDSGVSWTARESNRFWSSVASSADGQKLVAVEYGGQIYTSTDSGVSWTARESNRQWWSVASSADGSKLVAVAQNGQIYTSADSGVSWTARESDRQWKSVASSADGSKLVAVVNFAIYTSTDSGVSWTKHDVLGYWTSVASSADGSKLVAVQGGFSGPIYTSTDSGVSWTEREGNRDWQSVASSADGNKLVAVQNGGQIYTSGSAVASGGPGTVATLQHLGDGQWRALGAADGTVASAQLAPDLTLGGITSGSFSGDFNGTVSVPDGTITGSKIAPGTITGGMLADGAVTSSHIAAGTVLPTQSITGTTQSAVPNTSYATTDPAHTLIDLTSTGADVGDTVQITAQQGGWTAASSEWTPRAGDGVWFDIASSADGSRLFAVRALAGQGIATSSDAGVTWTELSPPGISGLNWNSVAVSDDGRRVVVTAWSWVISGTTVGASVFISSDFGVNWTQSSDGLPQGEPSAWVVASSGDGSKLVLAGKDERIYTSTNFGGTWTARDSVRNWIAVASSSDGTRLIAAENGGRIYTSTNSGVTWTARESNRNWISVASSADGQELVAAVGGGQIYTSTDAGVSWTARESNREWRSVASSADGRRFVAVAYLGQIYVSRDAGITWEAQESDRAWTSVASSADGQRLVAAQRGADEGIYTSRIFAAGSAGSMATLQYAGNGEWIPLSPPDSTVSGASLDSGSVGVLQLANNSVNSTKIVDGTIGAADLSPTIGLWNVAGGDVYRSNGDVGIGTASPSAKLDVAGSSRLGGNPGHLFAEGSGSGYTVNHVADATGYLVNVGSAIRGVRWAINGYEKMRIDASGNVGIGTASPSALLDVTGPTHSTIEATARDGSAYLVLESYRDVFNHSSIIGRGARGTAGSPAALGSGESALELLGQGRVGTASWANLARIYMKADASPVAGDSPGSIVFQTVPDGSGTLTDRMIIAANGRVGIGEASPDYPLHVGGSTAFNLTGVPNYFFAFNNPLVQGATGTANIGLMVSNGLVRAVGFVATSDERIKHVKGISDSANDLDLISRLRVTDYRLIDQLREPSGMKKGLIAQEVEKLIPEAVTETVGFVPNVYALIESADRNPDANETTIRLKKEHHLEADTTIQILADEGETFKCVVKHIVDDQTFVIEGTPEWDKGLVYGSQVDDFRAVDYDRIFVTAVSALQQLKKEKDTEVAKLRQENVEAKKELNALKERMRQLEAREAERAAREKEREARLAKLEQFIPKATAKPVKTAAND